MVNLLRASTATAIAGALALVGLGIPTVLAHQGSGTIGSVESVNGASAIGSCGTADAAGSFTILLANGTTDTVSVSTTTNFYGAGVTSATFADLCFGDWARVAGSGAVSPITATAVWISNPKAAGVVDSVDGGSATCGSAGATGSFTIQPWNPSSSAWTVDVSGPTLFYARGVTSATFLNVCVGDYANALGTLTATDTLSASKVGVQIPRLFGSVTAINGSSTTPLCGTAGAAGDFTITSWDKSTWTVDVTSTTTFPSKASPPATFADVCVGGSVSASGTISGTTLTANWVIVGAPWHRNPIAHPTAGHWHGIPGAGTKPYAGGPAKAGTIQGTSKPSDPAPGQGWGHGSPGGQRPGGHRGH